MENNERHDPLAAAKHAQQNARPNGVLPHYLRCDWVRGDWDSPGPKKRCRLGADHQGEHVYE